MVILSRKGTSKDILSHTNCHQNLFTPFCAMVDDLFLALSLYLIDLQTSGSSWASTGIEQHQKYFFCLLYLDSIPPTPLFKNFIKEEIIGQKLIIMGVPNVLENLG